MKEYPKWRRNTLLIVSLACAAAPAFGAGVVTKASQSDLQAAMAGGGAVTFALNGTILLTNPITVATSTVLDASGYEVTISGNNAVQIFSVSPGVNLVLENLTLARGFALGANGTNAGQGGAIFNAGSVAATNCSFLTNWAEGASNNPNGPAAPGQGGAIFNLGVLTASNCSFVGNWVQGGAGFGVAGVGPPYYGLGQSGGNANGGAIYNGSNAVIDNCLFTSNSAISGAPGNSYASAGENERGPSGADATGGAIWSDGILSVTNSNIGDNYCQGSAGGGGPDENGYGNGCPGGFAGVAMGAGVLAAGGQVWLVDSTFSGNWAEAGAGGGGGGANNGVTPGGSGAQGGQAAGGAACLLGGTFNVLACTFVANTVAAGPGGGGAPGDVTAYFSAGGNGGNGGNGTGGAIYGMGRTLSVVNSTFLSNSVVAGMGQDGGPGSGEFTGGNGGNGGNGAGGAICGDGTMISAMNVTFADNIATAAGGGSGGNSSWHFLGSNGVAGLVQGETIAQLQGAEPGTFTLLNTILSCATGESNAFGPIIDSGYNLNSDGAGFLTNSTSFNGVDPGLGAFGYFGGPTETISLLPKSIAIGHADPTNFPPTDQRGYPRPFGPAPDIGAFEYWPAPPNSLTASITLNAMFDLVFWGTNGQSFSTLASTNLINWIAISTNTIAASNSFQQLLPMNDGPGIFFQAISH